MAKINIFEILKYECKTHPEDVTWDINDPYHSILLDDNDPRLQLNVTVNFRRLVEKQGCNWKWYCEYFKFDSTRESDHPKNIREKINNIMATSNE